jgi:hypothetical protein
VIERDFDALQVQCNRPPSDWQAVPLFRTLLAAHGAYLQRDAGRVALLLAKLDDQRARLPYYDRHLMALLEDKRDAAAEHLESALTRGEPFALYVIQGQALQRSVFPEFYASDRYQDILRKFELDAESVAKLSIPSLPF